MHHYYIYILSNWNRKILYVGFTNNLLRRIGEHQTGLFEGFTQQYHIHDLVYWEVFESPTEAIKREKEIKHWSRKEKNKLIATKNPQLRDLSKDIFQKITFSADSREVMT